MGLDVCESLIHWDTRYSTKLVQHISVDNTVYVLMAAAPLLREALILNAGGNILRSFVVTEFLAGGPNSLHVSVFREDIIRCRTVAHFCPG